MDQNHITPPHYKFTPSQQTFVGFIFCEYDEKSEYGIMKSRTTKLKDCIYIGSVKLNFHKNVRDLRLFNVIDDTPADETIACVNISLCQLIEKLILTPNKKVIIIPNPKATLDYVEINEHVQNFNCFRESHLLINMRTFVVTFGCLFSECGTFFTPPNQDCSSQDQVVDVSPFICLDLFRIREPLFNFKVKLPQRTGQLVVELCWESEPTKSFTFDLSDEISIERDVSCN